MSSATASSSPSTSASASPSSSSSSNNTAIALGVSLSIVALLAIALFIFWFLRRRRPHVSSQPHTTVRRNTVVDLSNPAFRVTPFGSPDGDTPRFVHEPGANMRGAHRRDDGGWEFSEMTPDNWSTFDLPTPLAGRHSLSGRSSLSCVSALGSKEKLKLQPGELTTRGFIEHDGDYDNPPPAYERAVGPSRGEV